MTKKRVYIAGHMGMVGSAINKRLKPLNEIDLITATKSELDLTNTSDVKDFIKSNFIDEVYMAAAKVGGIHANNTYPADFISQNLIIQNNIICAAYESNVKKLLFLGSSCIYPKNAEQPIAEEDLLSGKLELTNEPYAIAKIAGIKMCESYNRQYNCDFRSVMPTNLYGPNDNFHPQNSHVIPAMMSRFHEALVSNKDEVVIWGSGKPMREFLHVDDMASACIHIMNLDKEEFNSVIKNKMCSHVNIGTGKDITIYDLAFLMAKILNYKGKLTFDATKPDGTPRKVLNVRKLNSLGWQHKIDLNQGLSSTYEWFKNYQDELRV